MAKWWDALVLGIFLLNAAYIILMGRRLGISRSDKDRKQYPDADQYLSGPRQTHGGLHLLLLLECLLYAVFALLARESMPTAEVAAIGLPLVLAITATFTGAVMLDLIMWPRRNELTEYEAAIRSGTAPVRSEQPVSETSEDDLARMLARRNILNVALVLGNVGLILLIGLIEWRTGRWAPDSSWLESWPVLVTLQSKGLDLLLLGLSAAGYALLFLVAKAYAWLFPRLDRSGDLWERSAQRPLTTLLRLVAQTVYYVIAAIAVASLLLSALIVTVVRYNPVIVALYINMCFVFLPITIIFAVKAQKRTTRGLEAESGLIPDGAGGLRANHLAKLSGAAPAASGDLPATRRALGQVAIAAGLDGVPSLLRFPGDGLNAFVDGVGDHMVIGVSDAFAQGLSEGEQQAALASLVGRALGSMPDVFGQDGVPYAGSAAADLERITQVYLRGDHAGLMLTRSPESMLSALTRAIEATVGTSIPHLYGRYSAQMWVLPIDPSWLSPGRGDEASRAAMLAKRPEYERIRALREVVGAAGVAAPRPTGG